jgi:hypothetical protein
MKIVATPEARSFLAQFEHQYGGVVEELGRLSQAEKGQSALFEDLAALEQKVSSGGDDAQRSSALTARILRLAFKDKRLAGVRDAITEVEAERERLAAVGAPFGGSEVHGALLTSLDERRTSLVESAGGMLAAKLQEELGFLKDLNAKLVRIQFEITKQEKEALAASLAKSSLTQKVSQYGFSTATDDERVYWPLPRRVLARRARDLRLHPHARLPATYGRWLRAASLAEKRRLARRPRRRAKLTPRPDLWPLKASRVRARTAQGGHAKRQTSSIDFPFPALRPRRQLIHRPRRGGGGGA